MKKIISLLLALMLVFALVACTSKEDKGTPEESDETNTPEQNVETPEVIAHGELDIKYPAIIDVDQDVNANKVYKIGYANWNDENSISIIVRDSLVDAAKFYGVELMVFDNKQDPNQAMTNADTAIQAQVDYYLNFNQDESINAAIAKKLEDSGISMISIQTKARDGIDPEYHVDNQRIGSICGELLVKEANERWANEKPILFIAGHPEAGVNFITRANSAIEAVKAEMPDVKVFEISTDGSPEVTRQKTADFLTANPIGKVMMWCHIDQNTMGMLAAVKAAGREDDVIITSFGANPVVFTELKDPNSPIIGSVAQFSERFGWDLLPLVLKHLNDGTKPPIKTMPPLDIITKDNLSTYYPEN
ncbi:MAG: sugar ABC transporter substrate-binding protein [Firmicutes bacterium HGW-Firmicutes-7]|nr:MAG: sugar ABC transporter substrate-binding protein [Firmicutes bacterium HGW-Firmicutes-7]